MPNFLTADEIDALSLEDRIKYFAGRAEIDRQRRHDAAIAFVTPRHPRRDVIRALRANVTMIQNWQTRNQIVLDADVVRDGQEWRLYSSRDVLLLGVAVRLAEVGFKASLLQSVLETVKPFLQVGSAYLASNRPSYIIVLANGQVIGPEIGASIDFEDMPHGNFIVVRLDTLIREALEPLGFSITDGTADDMRNTVERLKAAKLPTDEAGK